MMSGLQGHGWCSEVLADGTREAGQASRLDRAHSVCSRIHGCKALTDHCDGRVRRPTAVCLMRTLPQQASLGLGTTLSLLPCPQ